MMGAYLAQTATWRRRTGQDGYGVPTFAADATITCRWEWKRRMVRSLTGDEIVSEARVFTRDAVNAGDVLVDPAGREWTVIGASPQYALNGSELFREVAL